MPRFRSSNLLPPGNGSPDRHNELFPASTGRWWWPLRGADAHHRYAGAVIGIRERRHQISQLPAGTAVRPDVVDAVFPIFLDAEGILHRVQGWLDLSQRGIRNRGPQALPGTWSASPLPAMLDWPAKIIRSTGWAWADSDGWDSSVVTAGSSPVSAEEVSVAGSNTSPSDCDVCICVVSSCAVSVCAVSVLAGMLACRPQAVRRKGGQEQGRKVSM